MSRTASHSMHSFLIVSKEDQEKEIQRLLKELSIDPLDVSVLDPEKTIGIEDIRTIQKTLFLKPLKGSKRAVIIKKAQRLTLQSQNALLKTLEEPPSHAILILTTEKKGSLVPTVISRCQVLEIKEQKIFKKEELEKHKKMIQNFSSFSVAHRMKYAQDGATSKEEALALLETLIFSGREMLLENPETKLARFLLKIQKTHTIISTTNVNLRFALEELFLSL